MRDANGNVTHYVINDTGTGTSGRMVPADQFHQSLDTGPAAITDAPIRTPTEPRSAGLPADDAPAGGEAPGAPRDAASRGDPVSERGDPSSEGSDPPSSERAPESANPAEEANPADTPEAKASGEDVKAAGDGDPTVQTGDRPGGLKSGEGEAGSGTKIESEPTPGTRKAISQADYKFLRGKTPTTELKDLVNEGKPDLPYKDPVLKGLDVTERLEPDHTISMKTITEMKDFDKLSREDQIKVLNYEKNFEGLSNSANTSKQAKSWEDWTHYKKGKHGEIEVDKIFRQDMIQKAKDLSVELPKYIQSLLPKPPP